MGTATFAIYEFHNPKKDLMTEYLSSEDGYWLKNDQWYIQSEGFQKSGITPSKRQKTGMIADFKGYQCEDMKLEMKYFLLYSLKEKLISTSSILANYVKSIRLIGTLLASNKRVTSFSELKADAEEIDSAELKESEKKCYLWLRNDIRTFTSDFYDDRDELEKDVWHAIRIPGAKLSATMKRQKPSMNFERIPEYYCASVKRFMSRLVIKRSWSHCTEMLVYIRYFYNAFYGHGYGDGFLEELSRKDMEKYLGWVASDYVSKNATFRSKSVSFIRTYLDYIQLAEYPQAPQKDVSRLIFDDDIPKRERSEDTLEKVKFIPEPVRMELDASMHEIEPSEMLPVYVLLRETGWRGTDVLNLRYDNCLIYLWNEREQKYIGYLCGEITKTGIPFLKIPVRDEVADMVKRLKKEAELKSNDDNNPERYLFNIYEGRCKGLPYSKPAFASAVQELISRKGILDGSGSPYHFKTHSLRHTRASEYTEQGMPIGIIQQILGHCSLQMTLHYAKVSEDMLYKKWKETEALNLLHLERTPQNMERQEKEDIRYEYVRHNLDAVKVPFGVCFKPSKLACKHQISHCLECSNFCSKKENIEEYEDEIKRVRKLLEISRIQGRHDWEEKNQQYLEILEKMKKRIEKDGIVHKNGNVREDCNG